MTGPKARVLSGYSSLGHQHVKPDETESHPGTRLFYRVLKGCFFLIETSHLIDEEYATLVRVSQ